MKIGWLGGKQRILLALVFGISLIGCAATHLGRTRMVGPTGLISDISHCNAACVEKIEVAGGGEKCVRFATEMAKVCFEQKDKEMPRGTFVLTKTP